MSPAVLILCLWALFSTDILAVSDCNGHGRLFGRNSSHCVCEGPYTGADCELCQDGYYGDPRDGGPCFLSCRQSRHLTQFTTAGVGVSNQFLHQNPPDTRGSLCVWVLDPVTQVNLEEYSNTESNKSVANTTMLLHINSSSFKISETLLVYRGLPSFLEFANPKSVFFNSSSFTNHFNASQHNSSSNNSTSQPHNRQNLLFSLAGGLLRENTLSLHSNLVTLVYLYRGNGAGARETAGFNVTVRVTERNSSVADNVSHHDVITGENPYLQPTILIPSLSELLSQQSNTTCHEPSNQVVTSTNDTVANNSILNETHSCSARTCPSPLGCEGVCPRGRYWHSSVYDASTGSLWLFGGVDLTGEVCDGVVVVNVSQVAMEMEPSEVWRVSGVESEPSGRYLHTAVLARCPGNNSGSCMVVFGGFPSMATLSMPSREAWLYRGDTESWTRLTDAPEGVGVAAHSSVMIRNNRMLVIGGVRNGQVSSLVLTYDVDVSVWDVWERGAVPGLYGHSAVFDNTTNSVYLYGGVVYSHPTADVSNSLYVLELETRNWARVVLAVETPGRLFHSMLLVNQTLFITGGLVKSGPSLLTAYPSLDPLVHSSSSLVIDVGSRCNVGRTVLVSDENLPLWGHSAVRYGDREALISGGFDGAAVDSVSVLTLPSNFSCSLATSLDQCQTIPFCESCVNSTHFIGCFHSDDRLLCNSTDTQLIPTVTNCSIGRREACSQFSDCVECVSADIAQELGCVWCGCTSSVGCVDSTASCSCERIVSNYDNIKDFCPVDFCSSPSCQECVADSDCGWTFVKITPNLQQTSIDLSPDRPEWSCHSTSVNNIVSRQLTDLSTTTVSTCPDACEAATTCDECVRADSSSGGPLHCVWAVHSGTCVSHDLAPLVCADGLCGGFVTDGDQCPLPCSAHSDCSDCLVEPLCSYYLGVTNERFVGYCTDAPSSLITLATISGDILHANGTLLLRRFYSSSCPGCSNSCSGHGSCVFSELRCECDLGYVGGDCSVECECSGLSTCANETEEGRRECLHCQLNTQGPSCSQCQPLFVGRPDDGLGCISCHEYCHGNSQLCLRRSELNEALERNVTLSRALLLVESGPSMEEGVCVECEGFSTGETCNTCLHGYHNENFNRSSLVSCIECPCNGHGDCDADTAVCDCGNNTRSELCEGGSPCSVDLQCNFCVEGYTGAPSDNNQCYRELAIDRLNNFTVLPKQSLPLAIGLDYFFSNVDVQVQFVISYGELEIYDALNNRAVSVAVDPETFQHEVTIRSGFELTRLTRDAPPADAVSMETLSVSKRQGADSRDLFSTVFVHEVTSSRYSFVISSDQTGFQTEQHFLTILAGPVGARFFMYYQQESSQLNYFVFLSGLVSSFVLTFGVSLLLWKGIKLEMRWRNRARERRLRSARTRRPFARVQVFFDRKKVGEVKEKHSNPLFSLKPPLEESAIVTTPTQSAAESGDKEEQIKMQPVTKNRKKFGWRRRNVIAPCDLSPWPVAQQTLRDERVSVSTMLVKLPSKSKTSGAHVICTASCLALRPKEEEKKKWKMKDNRCVPVDSGVLEMELSSEL